MARQACSAPTRCYFSLLVLLFTCLSSQAYASELDTTQAAIMQSIFDTIGLHMSPYKLLNTTAADPCVWNGVTCTSSDTSNVVTELSFSDLGISFNNSTALSSFFSLVCALDTLVSLNVSSNCFTSLPGAFFSSCTALNTLDLSQNSLSGEIPPQFKNLKYLSGLYLNGNNLNGSIPSTIIYMTNLLNLQLGDNKLHGSIPVIPHAITALNLSHNYFSGEIPSFSFSNSPELEILDLSHNKFSGLVPDSLTSLQFLTLLDLSYNHLSGELPTFHSWVNLVITGNILSSNITDSNSKKKISTVFLVVIVGSFVNGIIASVSLAFVITTCLKKPEGTDSEHSRPHGTRTTSVETPSLDRYLEMVQRWQHAARVEGCRQQHRPMTPIERYRALALYD